MGNVITREQSKAGLRQLMKKNNINFDLPLLPFWRNSPRIKFFKDDFRECLLDKCSDKNNNCDTCPDVDQCRKYYDVMC